MQKTRVLTVIIIVEHTVGKIYIELPPVCDTSCLAELTYDLIDNQFPCGNCPKSVTIQYLHTVGYSSCNGHHSSVSECHKRLSRKNCIVEY